MAAPGLDPTPPGELRMRQARVGSALAAAGLEGALLATGASSFYLCGLALDGYVWVDASGQTTWLVKRGLERASEESGFHGTLVGVRNLRQVRESLPALRGRVGLEMDVLPVGVHDRLAALLGPEVALADCSELLREVRAVKSPLEISLVERAAAQCAEIFEVIPQLLQPGRQEVEVAADIEQRLRMGGHPMLLPVHRWGQRACPVYLCAGPTSCLPGSFLGLLGGSGLSGMDPQGVGRRTLRPGEPVVVDICCVQGGYIADQTMTFALGSLPEELQRAHRVALEIRDRVAAQLRPGTVRKVVWEEALHMAREAGLEEHFQGLGRDRLRFIGHGVGIEIDEQPVLAPGQELALEAGMVIACEPKFFFAGRGAVGVEDTYAVTPGGGRRLTQGLDLLPIRDGP